VDFENVQDHDLDRIAHKPIKVTLVLGRRHKSLPVQLVKLIQRYASQVALVETRLDGKNALDFVIACPLRIPARRPRNGRKFPGVPSHDRAREREFIDVEEAELF
jgi:hypothetical protein